MRVEVYKDIIGAKQHYEGELIDCLMSPSHAVYVIICKDDGTFTEELLENITKVEPPKLEPTLVSEEILKQLPPDEKDE